MQETKILQQDHESSFHKHLSKFSCLMIGIGGLIGGGIFSVVGVISKFTGPYAYISYFITGISTLFTVYSYQKLTSKWCSPGGEYTCVQGALYGSKFQNLGLFTGILLIFGYISSMALYSYTFSVYCLLFFNIKYNFSLIIIIVIFLNITFILLNLKGVKESSRIQNLLVLIKLLILVIFSLFGIRFALRDTNQLIINIGLDTKSINNISFMGILLGSSLIIVSYQGFQLITYASFEMEDKEGGLKMMKWALIISLIIYCFVALTAVALIGVSGLIGNAVHDAEIAIGNAALSFLGRYGMMIIVLGALLSTASALNATLFGSSRLTYMMSIDKVLPKYLSKVSKNKVPYISILTIGFLSIILTISTGGALSIAGIAGFIFAQIFFIINFANYKARKSTKSNPIIPIIGMTLTSLFFTILIIYSFINIKYEMVNIVSFFLIESISLFFIFHINSKNNNEKKNTN
ncbi:MAG: APC family permease [Promethearchaeota archaeon]